MKHASILFDLLEIQLRSKEAFEDKESNSRNLRIGQILYFASVLYNMNDILNDVDCYYNDKNIPKFLQEIYNQLTEL